MQPSQCAQHEGGTDRVRHRVLLVDDEQPVLRSLVRLLRGEPYDIVTTTSPSEALELLQQYPVHLVVTDQRMPEMSGTELLAKIREHWPDTIRIVLSGYSEVNAILAAVNQGAIYQFLTKPWNDEEVRLQVRRALEQYDLAAQNRVLLAELEIRNAYVSRLNDQLMHHVADAARGLACCHQILEGADVGIVTIDRDGMIVSANRRALELLDGDEVVALGSPASQKLPTEVMLAVAPCEEPAHAGVVRRLNIGGHTYQWRGRSFTEVAPGLGLVIAFWKDAA